MVNFTPRNVTFNPGDAVDVNVQRSLGNIGNFYADDVLLPLQLAGGNNTVLDLNEHQGAAETSNVQQTLDNIQQFNADDTKSPFELANGDNQLLNLNEELDYEDEYEYEYE